MTGPGRMQRGFLGEAALRLSRLLQLDGLVTPQFDTGERITPVVLVGDATIPGMGATRGRRFMVNLRAGAGANAALRMAADAEPIILEQLVFASSAAEIIAMALHFDNADPASQNSALLDRTGGAIEPGPGLVSCIQANLGTIIGEFQLVGAANPLQVPLGFMLNARASIQFRHGATTTVGFVIGRTF